MGRCFASYTFCHAYEIWFFYRCVISFTFSFTFCFPRCQFYEAHSLLLPLFQGIWYRKWSIKHSDDVIDHRPFYFRYAHLVLFFVRFAVDRISSEIYSPLNRLLARKNRLPLDSMRRFRKTLFVLLSCRLFESSVRNEMRIMSPTDEEEIEWKWHRWGIVDELVPTRWFYNSVRSLVL